MGVNMQEINSKLWIMGRIMEGAIKQFMKTDWGELFKKYPYGKFPEYKAVQEWDPY